MMLHTKYQGSSGFRQEGSFLCFPYIMLCLLFMIVHHPIMGNLALKSSKKMFLLFVFLSLLKSTQNQGSKPYLSPSTNKLS